MKLYSMLTLKHVPNIKKKTVKKMSGTEEVVYKSKKMYISLIHK